MGMLTSPKGAKKASISQGLTCPVIQKSVAMASTLLSRANPNQKNAQRRRATASSTSTRARSWALLCKREGEVCSGSVRGIGDNATFVEIVRGLRRGSGKKGEAQRPTLIIARHSRRAMQSCI
jgi:hypothetical protein